MQNPKKDERYQIISNCLDEISSDIHSKKDIRFHKKVADYLCTREENAILNDWIYGLKQQMDKDGKINDPCVSVVSNKYFIQTIMYRLSKDKASEFEKAITSPQYGRELKKLIYDSYKVNLQGKTKYGTGTILKYYKDMYRKPVTNFRPNDIIVKIIEIDLMQINKGGYRRWMQ